MMSFGWFFFLSSSFTIHMQCMSFLCCEHKIHWRRKLFHAIFACAFCTLSCLHCEWIESRLQHIRQSRITSVLWIAKKNWNRKIFFYVKIKMQLLTLPLTAEFSASNVQLFCANKRENGERMDGRNGICSFSILLRCGAFRYDFFFTTCLGGPFTDLIAALTNSRME